MEGLVKFMTLKHREEYRELSRLFDEYCKKEDRNSMESKKDVIEFLNNLDMDLIKEIQIILYIGCKDNKCESKEEAEKLFNKTMESFDMLKGWRTKDIEIKNMVIDNPLNEYFKNGIEILKLEV